MKVFAPGKLILSGEHAVLYGSPALAMSINRYATATVTQEKSPQVFFDLSDIAHRSRLSFQGLRELKNRIKRKYHRFVQGDFTIREVLQKPFELAQFAMSIFAESFNFTLPHGVKVHVTSDIPVGCGMGSSAATILSVMLAISHHLNKPLSNEALLQLALVAENMQHGKSSGLDLHIALRGGCLYVKENELIERPLPEFSFYAVNTGSPVSTTGQCVEQVKPYFASQQLKDDFTAVTTTMDMALQQRNMSDFYEMVHQNHLLLKHIGVVPEKVQHFIAQIEAMQGAAKICGAGAVTGDKGGVVLVMAEDKAAVALLCQRFGYELMSIAGEKRGVHVL
ncbi:MAG TPA: mevalonate kinase [Gammaproteobacteria bacterium]|jgi:mevalonate kinase|nr:mevalonate kinase [Gammaproteobacteria bacterium]